MKSIIIKLMLGLMVLVHQGESDSSKGGCPAITLTGCKKGYDIRCCKSTDCSDGEVCCLHSQGCEIKCMKPDPKNSADPFEESIEKCIKWNKPETCPGCDGDKPKIGSTSCKGGCPPITLKDCAKGYDVQCCNSSECSDGEVCCFHNQDCAIKCMKPDRKSRVDPFEESEDKCMTWKTPETCLGCSGGNFQIVVATKSKSQCKRGLF